MSKEPITVGQLVELLEQHTTGDMPVVMDAESTTRYCEVTGIDIDVVDRQTTVILTDQHAEFKPRDKRKLSRNDIQVLQATLGLHTAVLDTLDEEFVRRLIYTALNGGPED